MACAVLHNLAIDMQEELPEDDDDYNLDDDNDVSLSAGGSGNTSRADAAVRNEIITWFAEN